MSRWKKGEYVWTPHSKRRLMEEHRHSAHTAIHYSPPTCTNHSHKHRLTLAHRMHSTCSKVNKLHIKDKKNKKINISLHIIPFTIDDWSVSRRNIKSSDFSTTGLTQTTQYTEWKTVKQSAKMIIQYSLRHLFILFKSFFLACDK